MLISLYSLLLAVALTLSSPWWLYRMLAGERYRAGILQRLGRVPATLRAAASGKQVVWLHAVSVGEFLAAQRLITELQQTLGPTWIIAVSTTTATAHKLARERLHASNGSSSFRKTEESASASPPLPQAAPPLFFYPLDFAFAVRPYLRALNPRLVILMESELWPRLLHECAAARVPVAVANARVSDRSFRRTFPLRSLWLRMARHVTLFLAQSHETASRLEALGIPPTRIQTPGNLKYDLKLPEPTRVSSCIHQIAAARPIIVAGSTLPAARPSLLNEEKMLIQAWEGTPRTLGALLVLAPRHPDRFDEVAATASEYKCLRATQLRTIPPTNASVPHSSRGDEWETCIPNNPSPGSEPQIILLDTLGDLASVYSLASVAFIGGSLVPRGGHNPLEAARFGVPVLMGPSFENFREIVDSMRAADAIRIITPETLGTELTDLLQHGQPVGQRAQTFFQSQSGATARTLAALLPLLEAAP